MRKIEEFDLQKLIISHFRALYCCVNDCILVHGRASRSDTLFISIKKVIYFVGCTSSKISLDAKLSKRENLVKFA